MSSLLNALKTRKIELPSYPGSEVEIYDGLLTKDAISLAKSDNDFQNGVELLKKIIKKWSFVDEEGKEVEVTEESLGFLPMTDFSFLMDEVNKSMSFLEKKELKK